MPLKVSGTWISIKMTDVLQDEELQKFLILLSKANKFGSATVQSPSPGQARRIRRHFYTLRNRLTGVDRDNANKLSFRLNGSQIVVELSLSNWTTGVVQDARNNQPKLT